MGWVQEIAKQRPKDIYVECKARSYAVFEFLKKIGKLEYSETCQECGQPRQRGKGGMHFHHADYHYPGRVKCLCPKCHFSKHGYPRLPIGIKAIREALRISNGSISFSRIKDLEAQNA